MQENSTSITYDRVESDANTITECASTMNNIFSDFEAAMNRLGGGDALVGDAGESLFSRFNNLKTKFDEYITLVNDFADLIRSASQKTAATEQALASQADELAN